MTSKLVHVAVAVIVDSQQQVLIALRQSHQHQGNLWEFPGGKVEQGESVIAALQREIEEEVGLRVNTAEPFSQIQHDYGDKSVLLDIHLVDAFQGNAEGKEGQKIKWCPVTDLAQLDFPEANKTIIQQLEAHYSVQIDSKVNKG